MSAVATAVDVGAVDEFEHAVARIVQVEGREVAVVRWHDGFYALRNVCPHQSQSFAKGAVRREVRATPDGALELGPPVLACPWHCWPFDLATGRCTADPQKRIRAFPVQVADGRVRVVVERQPQPTP